MTFNYNFSDIKLNVVFITSMFIASWSLIESNKLFIKVWQNAKRMLSILLKSILNLSLIDLWMNAIYPRNSYSTLIWKCSLAHTNWFAVIIIWALLYFLLSITKLWKIRFRWIACIIKKITSFIFSENQFIWKRLIALIPSHII